MRDGRRIVERMSARSRRIRFTGLRAIVVVGLTALAVAVAATRFDFLQGTGTLGSVGSRPAPEFSGIAGWINSDPLSIRSLRGRVVWIDFWTYTCVNCVRTLPFVRAMYDRYREAGLEIVGVHSPEFAFERDRRNVESAIERHDVRWPVALDNDMSTWRGYENNEWPHVYLIDASGRIRFDVAGEGADEEIERWVRMLLQPITPTLPPPVDANAILPGPRTTPEIYLGWERGSLQGSLGNPEGFRPGRIVRYAPVSRDRMSLAGTGGVVFLEGEWRNEREYLEAASPDARLHLMFRARDVFIVAATSSGSARVHVTLDDRSIDAAFSGADVKEGVATVDRQDLFRIVASRAQGTHRLTLASGTGLRLYTFTFG
jgi:thiol-disulfide isomerase/thioredoxin